MKDSFEHVLDNTMAKWKDNMEINVETISVGRSFMKHHMKYKDTYLKYIQFQTLRHRFFTNEKLFKMGSKSSKLCGLCHTEIDSVEHMLLK